ncbi:cell division protein ZapE [Acetobacter sp. AN02]|uniref:cell division protein ZapE n=1 Tax=Acetobacter sp. AN02 TaxID=2894186 RepID=UPI002434403A|nr:cell division protein ZapE [Acetobacter sp. AN02]MDG6094042.1 cell division protein ZapE [Acetobacter sp. AN02]
MNAISASEQAAALKGPRALYEACIASGQLRPDPDQVRVAARLDQLWHELRGWTPAPPPAPAAKGFLGGLMSRLRPEAEPPKPPRGVYIVGRVGRGKTMLMDLFFSCATIEPKRRIHFLKFMQEIHTRLRDLKRQNPGMADPIPPLADEIRDEARLLCFDEFQINDIADAMLLGRLFEALFARQVIIVATSNTVPGDLFQNRPGADAFRPFIAIIRRELDTAELDSENDYRRGREQDDATWITPADETARRRLDRIEERYAGDAKAEETVLHLAAGRDLEVDHARGPVARFAFNSLCAKPLGPPDFLALAQRFPVIVVDDIPALTPDDANVARRFITLIDALYDNGNLLFVSADDTPDHLFPEGEGSDAFARTASRLAEMGSESWLERAGQKDDRLSRA